MANMLFANNCTTTLASSLTSGATSMSVTSATGFPSPTGVQYFYCTLADAATQTTIEIVKVTSVSGTTFAITRAQDGTSATAFAAGAVVSLRLVRASLNDFPKLDETNTFNADQAISGQLTSSAGLATTGTFTATAPSDGLVMDYATGFGRFSAFAGDGFQWYNAGIANTKLMQLSSSGAITTATWNGNTVGVAYGGTGVTASSGANSVVLRDSNQNVFANNFIPNTTTTVASSTPINLTVASAQYQIVTGSVTSQTFNMPDATTLTVGDTYYFNNNITYSSVQINAHDGSTSLLALQAGGAAHLILLTNSTSNGTWDVHSYIPSTVSWGTATLNFNSSSSISGSVSWLGNAVGVAYGGTGLTTLTAGYIPYGNGTSAFSSTSNLQYSSTVLSVGVSPSSWSLSGYYALEVGIAGNSIFSGLGDTNLSCNAYYNGGWKYAATGVNSGIYNINGNIHLWRIAGAGTAGNTIGFTSAMTLDGSGRLLLNTTSATSLFTLKQSANSYAGAFSLISSNTTNYWSQVVAVTNDLYFGYNGADKGYFSSSTGVYTPLSDINKKKDFAPSKLGLDAVNALKPTLFRMIDDEESAPLSLGFIAQDIKDVIPQAYFEQPSPSGETFIGIQDRPIIAVLVKAIQEQQAIIEQLKAKVGL